jgi:hypothetical protein
MKKTPGSKATAKINKAKYQLERERHREKIRRRKTAVEITEETLNKGE